LPAAIFLPPSPLKPIWSQRSMTKPFSLLELSDQPIRTNTKEFPDRSAPLVGALLSTEPQVSVRPPDELCETKQVDCRSAGVFPDSRDVALHAIMPMIEQSSVFVVSRAARAAAPEPVGAWVAQADSANPKTTHINQRLPWNPHGLMFRECMKSLCRR